MNPIHSNDYPQSYYHSSINYLPDYPKLEQSVEADVCIVGGGFTGVASAVELAERGFKVVIVEAYKIGWGASGRNGGQIISGIGHDTEQFRNTIGQEGIDRLFSMGRAMNQIVIDRINQYQIECDLTMGYCDLATRQKDLISLEKDLEFLEKNKFSHNKKMINKNELAEQIIDSNFYLGGLEDGDSGHLHPLNLCIGEAKVAESLGVKIFQNSEVISLTHGDKNIVKTKQGQVVASKVILAGNAYLGKLEPKNSGKILPAGSYIIATEILQETVYKSLLPNNHAVCDQRIDLDYFRLSADKRLLFGGMCNYSGRDPKDIKAALLPKMLKVFPQLENTKIDFQWGGMIGIGANRLPQIGRLEKNVYFAQAYSGHGVNVTHLAAKLVADAICVEDGTVDSNDTTGSKDTYTSSDFEIFNKVKHITFPGGEYLRSPLLALGMMYHKMVDMF